MLREWLIGRRNAMFASPAFQRAATRFPMTRPIARRHARRLFDLVAGFTYSQTLAACVALDLFARLAQGPARIDEIAAGAEVPRASIDRLVAAAVALELLERLTDDRVTLGPVGAALVGNPGMTAMIAHHRHLYADLADPVAMLREPGTGALAAFWAYAQGREPEAVAAYSELMAASLPPVAEQLLDAYDVRRHRRLLDVAGGEGAFLAEVAGRAPDLDLGLFDLPAVVARAHARSIGRVRLHAGDFQTDALPPGYDCVTLVRVLLDHDDATVLRLLRSIRAALPPRGRLLITEPMLDAAGRDRVGATYFGLYLLAMGGGRPRRPAEIGVLLIEAGFTNWREIRTALPLVSQVVLGTT